MTESRRIAGLLGPTLVALILSEAMNPGIWTTTLSPVLVYQAGLMWFIAGVAIVRAHNRWTRGWPVLVTFMGWFLMLGGLVRMVAPERAQQQTGNPTAVVAIQVALLATGLVLTFKAYFGRE